MPSIKLSRKVLESLIAKKLSTEELKDRISYLGTDLEGIDGDEISVEVFPNRPDMLSEQGFGRALASFIGTRPGLRNYIAKPTQHSVIIDPSVAGVRPYTVCAIVRDLRMDDEKIKELIQIQEKLHITYGRHRRKAAIGIYPLDKIVLPINYTAISPDKIKFRPLESEREMSASQILSVHPAGKDYAHLLEGQTLYPIFKDAKGNIMSMPPIINSHLTGRIDESTRDVFIECSGFDYNTLSLCLNMIVTTLADMGGRIESMILKYPDGDKISPDLTPRKMQLDASYVMKRSGIELTLQEIKTYLGRMGYGVEEGKRLIVLIPPYRADILHPVDLVEDIVIAYGYDRLTPEIPSIATIAQENPDYERQMKAANVLVGMGFQEVLNYHLSNDEDQKLRVNSDNETIPLKSAVNMEYNVLRASLLPGLLRVLVTNKHHEYPQRVFEMGTVFAKSKKTETGIFESLSLAVLNAHQTSDFTEIKQQLDALLRAFDLKYKIVAEDNPTFIAGRSGLIEINGKKAGYLGEISPSVLSAFELSQPASAFYLDLSLLFEQL